MPLCTRVRFSFSITIRFSLFLFFFFFLIYEFNNICVFGRSFESHVFTSDKGPAMPSKHSANDGAERTAAATAAAHQNARRRNCTDQLFCVVVKTVRRLAICTLFRFPFVRLFRTFAKSWVNEREFVGEIMLPFKNDYYVNNNSFELCGEQFVYLLTSRGFVECG